MSHKENRWRAFESPKQYHIEDLGRPAIFLIPKTKLGKRLRWPGNSVFGGTEEADCKWFIEHYLAEQFGAFTVTETPVFGIWSKDHMISHDACVQYEVSFVGKEKVASIIEVLAFIAKQIGEECIYFKAGQYACLIYPSRRKKRSKKK